MTPRELFIHALERKAPVKGTRVPHFELVFFLTMEAFGKVHTSQRKYDQWDQMKEKERRLHIGDMADMFIKTAERFEHNAIFIHQAPHGREAVVNIANEIRKRSGDRYFLMIHGDATYGLPDGDSMLEFVYWLADHPEDAKAKADRMVEDALKDAEFYKKETSLDGFALCSDYALNVGPFLSPAQFSEFVAPYLKKLVSEYRKMRYYTIKHTDGNIMPIIDQIVDCAPHALHSLDPQGGVDIKTIKEKYGGRICLIGNVNNALMDTGKDEQIIASAEYALKHGMPGGGYIFSSSNCVYTGMELRKYELILDVWRRLGNY